MMITKKRGAIYSVIALMLCVAIYLNWSYNKTDGDYSSASDIEDGKILGEAKLVDGETGGTEGDGSTEVSGADGGNYFATARLSRQKARDEAVGILNVTIENPSAAEEAKQEANESIETMAQSAMMESRIENLVIAKGYTDCVVFINDNGVNVIIEKPEGGIQDADVAKIKDIVISEASVTADMIKIIETE